MQQPGLSVLLVYSSWQHRVLILDKMPRHDLSGVHTLASATAAVCARLTPSSNKTGKMKTPLYCMPVPISPFLAAMPMTYEAYLDEVTTLMTEMFDMSDEDAINEVVRAQAADFFTLHDDHPEMRTQERAVQDAKTIFEQRKKPRPATAQKRAGKPGK